MGAPWLTSPLEVVGSSLGALDLLVAVLHEAWIGDDSYNQPVYAPPVELAAMVQEGTNQSRTTRGEDITVRACVTFFAPVPHNGAPGRREPFDPRDRLTVTLEGGEQVTGPVVDNVGAQLVKTSTGVLRPVHSVWLR